MQLRSASYNQIQQISAALLSWGLQRTWVIDPATGDDAGNGDASSPLKTMGEFNARMSGNFVQVAATLQLVGDVVDAPLSFNSTRFSSAGSMTVFGTKTDVGTASITAVTGLGDTAARVPWQITTGAGINWTTVDLNSQVRTSLGVVGMIVEVIDANNVILGPVGTPLVTGSVTVAPLVGQTVTVATLSRALPPQSNGMAAFGIFGTPVLVQDLNFNSPTGFGVVGVGQYAITGSLGFLFYGCVFNFLTAQSQFFAGASVGIRCCRWNASQQVSWRAGPDVPQITGLVIAGTGSTIYNHQAGTYAYTSPIFIGARLFNTGCVMQVGGGHSRKTGTSCVTVQNGGFLNFVTSPFNSGVSPSASGNTGIGLDCADGRISYSSSAKPTVTGTSDTRVGGVAKTYANIPFINATLNAIPPTVQTLTGNLAAIVQV